jgi:hypothetical protein
MERRIIGCKPAIETLGHALDYLANRHVTDTHFPQILVHVGEHQIKQFLRQLSRLFSFLAQASKNKDRMQRDHIEPTVRRIRYAKCLVKARRASLFDDPEI